MKNWIKGKIAAYRTEQDRRRFELRASLCFNEYRPGRMVSY